MRISDWSSDVCSSDLPTPQLSFLLRYWLGLQDSDGRVAPDRIDPMQMRPALGHIMLLDVLDGGADYRYRVYGSEIAQRAGFDMTGKCPSELPTGSQIGRASGRERGCQYG